MSGDALLDCGHGRRLERLGGVVVDRPAPAATTAPQLDAAVWAEAGLRYDRDGGWQGAAPDPWLGSVGGMTMRLRPAAGGQVGVFPEHAAAADRTLALLGDAGGCRVLNLFAHTGLATLKLAAAGAEVAHVDAAAAAVATARDNARLNGLEQAPVRWIADDALAFARREVRRGRRYHAVVADPPAYGRAKKAEWKLERDLPLLLDAAAALLRDDGALLCLTCHSEGWDGDRLAAAARAALPRWRAEVLPLVLAAAPGGNDLRAGWGVWVEI